MDITPFQKLVDRLILELEFQADTGTRYVPMSPVGLPAHQAQAQTMASGSAQTNHTATASERREPTHLFARDQLEKAESKQARLERLRRQVEQCQKCPNLARTRTNVVFGTGNPNAELMFVGEAPGVEEDRQGEPFVGAAGRLLTRIIETMGLKREDVYIGNVLKCRPDTPTPFGNRKPTPLEISRCVPYLIEQIRIIQPKVLVALGSTAVEGLLGRQAAKEGIVKLRGRWLEFEGIPLMPTYHPAYVLRNPSREVKRQIWEDMLAVMEKLGLPISEKQRNYFLKSSAE